MGSPNNLLNRTLYAAYLESRSVCTDTRSLKSGDLFFALKGPNFNGNRFAAQALESGALRVVLDEKPDNPALAAEPRVVLVPDVLQSLQDLARTHRRTFDFPVFALTGSNGKTTTKELLAAVLARRYRVSATAGNLNNHIGVPLTLLRVPAEADFVVVEMGANAQREIAGLCAIAEPDAGLITNIGDAHLEGFGGREGVKKGKGELFHDLRLRQGTLFCWSDSADLRDLAGSYSPCLRYGTGAENDVAYQVLPADRYAAVSLYFQGAFQQAECRVHSQLLGDYNAPNLAAAACVGAYYGVEPKEITAALEAYKPGNQRSEWRILGTNRLYLDAYNANPSSMRAALESLRQLESGSRKGAILGDMKELGPYSAEAHREIAILAGEAGLELLVFIGPEFGQVERPASSICFNTAAEASEWLKANTPRDMTLLLKGSRGIAVEKVMEGLMDLRMS